MATSNKQSRSRFKREHQLVNLTTTGRRHAPVKHSPHLPVTQNTLVCPSVHSHISNIRREREREIEKWRVRVWVRERESDERESVLRKNKGKGA